MRHGHVVSACSAPEFLNRDVHPDSVYCFCNITVTCCQWNVTESQYEMRQLRP
jgi:hypothetical protein